MDDSTVILVSQQAHLDVRKLVVGLPNSSFHFERSRLGPESDLASHRLESPPTPQQIPVVEHARASLPERMCCSRFLSPSGPFFWTTEYVIPRRPWIACSGCLASWLKYINPGHLPPPLSEYHFHITLLLLPLRLLIKQSTLPHKYKDNTKALTSPHHGPATPISPRSSLLGLCQLF
jgi:hypothetical protein